MINHGDLNDRLILDILSVTSGIDSDYDKSEVLKQLVKYCRGNEDLEDAFFEVVDAMDSDYEIKELYTLMYRGKRGSSGEHR